MDFALIEVETLLHSSGILNLCWKPDTASEIATSSADKVVMILLLSADSPTLPKHVLDAQRGAVSSCRWSPCCKLLATASLDGNVTLWGYNDGELTFEEAMEPCRMKGRSSVSWSTSGMFLANSGMDHAVWISKINTDDHSFDWTQSFQGHTNAVNMVHWHPTIDTLLFSCSSDNTIKVWAKCMDSEDGWGCVQTLDELYDGGHEAPVRALSFNASGDKMVSCSDDLSLKIWGADIQRMTSGELGYARWRHFFTLRGFHNGAIKSVHWSREGIICSAGADGSLCFYAEVENNQGNEPRYRFLLRRTGAHGGSAVNVVQWSCTDTTVLASGGADATVKIWRFVCPAERQ